MTPTPRSRVAGAPVVTPTPRPRVAPGSPVKLFPDEVKIPPMATAVLIKVAASPTDVVAHYELVPDDEVAYEDRFADLLVTAPSGRFMPLPGTSIRVVEADDDASEIHGEEGDIEDDLDLDDDDTVLVMQVGLHKGYGKALSAARAKRGWQMESLIPEYQIRAMLHGLLGVAGV